MLKNTIDVTEPILGIFKVLELATINPVEDRGIYFPFLTYLNGAS